MQGEFKTWQVLIGILIMFTIPFTWPFIFTFIIFGLITIHSIESDSPLDILAIFATIITSIIFFKSGDNFIGFMFAIGIPLELYIYARMRKEENERKERENRWEAGRPYREAENKRRQEEIYRQNQDILRIEELKKRIELEAMKTSMNYEKDNDRTPIDVSSQNLGYDIKSTGINETRFIEVKGKSNTSNILLTENEWNKALMLENSYYLYVVYDCPDNPQIYHVQNPASKLKSSYDSNTKKYSIDKYEIDKYAK